MRFVKTTPAVMTLLDTFYCRSRRGDQRLEQCLDGYVNANAFGRRRSACYRCPTGRKYRQEFAEGGNDSP